MAIALKLQHCIHNVFQHLGSGNAAFLRDMTDEHHGSAAFLGILQNGCSTFAYLRNAARRTVQAFARNGLY